DERCDGHSGPAGADGAADESGGAVGGHVPEAVTHNRPRRRQRAGVAISFDRRRTASMSRHRPGTAALTPCSITSVQFAFMACTFFFVRSRNASPNFFRSQFSRFAHTAY